MYLPQLDFAQYPREIFWAIIIFVLFYFLVTTFVIEKTGRNINSREIKINRLQKNIRKLDDDIIWLTREASAIKENASQKARAVIDAAKSDLEEAKLRGIINARGIYKLKAEQLQSHQREITDDEIQDTAKAIVSSMTEIKQN